MATTVATPLDFWRLAELAERRGIRILLEPISGEHFATSATDPTRLYWVTGFSCTRKGFQEWQRCTHHSLFLAQLGWLPDPTPDPEPDPSPAAPAAAAPPPVRPLPTRPRPPFRVGDGEPAAAKGEALRNHLLHGEPLVDVASGEVLAA